MIDQTEALTVIDVNTGKYIGGSNLEDTVLKTNIEAAKEIAKQLRLRDIGGIIIIDFIDMHEQEHQKMVLDTLKQALKRDRTKTTVVGMTGLGLIEMTRKKVRQELSSVMKIDCPHCDGTGKILSPESIARKAEKELISYLGRSESKAVEIEVHPSVGSVLTRHEGQIIPELESAFDKRIVVKLSNNVKYEEIKIHEIDMDTLVC